MAGGSRTTAPERVAGKAPSLAAALRTASSLVARVAAGRSLASEFERDGDTPPEAGRGAVLDLCHGALRRYGRMQAIVTALSQHRTPPLDIEALIWCALYALESGRYADYTVVDQAVSACAQLGKPRARGYVNALLRRWLRERPALEARLAQDPEARYQHPRWWIDALRRDLPEHWEKVLEAGNMHPPMCLRVNRRRASVEHYGERLAAVGIASRALDGAALLLDKPVPVERLPGFGDGEVSVQDAGAQRAAGFLDLADGQRVLDACAAPGGKSAHILEYAQVTLTALDVDRARCRRVGQSLARLGLVAEIRSEDCTDPEKWWDGTPFDRVLADAPCTASGVVRRHPDIKWLRRESDVARFATRQASILNALWRVLAAGGKLLYVTCSVFAEENENVVDAFCARTPGARRVALAAEAPARLLPNAEHDGFFFALLEKPA